MFYSKVNKRNINILCFILIVFSSNFIFSIELPELNKRINDYANIISFEYKTNIECYLEEFEKKSPVRISVLTIPALGGIDLEDFALKSIDRLNLMQDNKQNILLLVSALDRKIHIETGSGIKYKLSDIVCEFILQDIIAPEFFKGDYSQGLFKGIKYISSIILEDSEYTLNRKINFKVRLLRKQNIIGFTFIFLLILLSIFFQKWETIFFPSLKSGSTRFEGSEANGSW